MSSQKPRLTLCDRCSSVCHVRELFETVEDLQDTCASSAFGLVHSARRQLRNDLLLDIAVAPYSLIMKVRQPPL